MIASLNFTWEDKFFGCHVALVIADSNVGNCWAGWPHGERGAEPGVVREAVAPPQLPTQAAYRSTLRGRAACSPRNLPRRCSLCWSAPPLLPVRPVRRNSIYLPEGEDEADEWRPPGSEMSCGTQLSKREKRGARQGAVKTFHIALLTGRHHIVPTWHAT